MARLTTGVWMEVVSEFECRVLFSVATDVVDRDTFLENWNSLGKFLYKRFEGNKMQDQLRVRVAPITGKE